VYKWGYDRKMILRSLTKPNVSTDTTNDYNNIVDEILKLKAQEINIKRRKYTKRPKKALVKSSRNKQDVPKELFSQSKTSGKLNDSINCVDNIDEENLKHKTLGIKDLVGFPLNQDFKQSASLFNGADAADELKHLRNYKTRSITDIIC